MSTQNRFIRALRYATIALFLAAGLEGLKQVVFPNLSAGQSHIAAILVCAFVVFLLVLGLLRREEVQSEKVSENIIGNLPEIACIFDDAGKFRQWNSSCEGPRGYTASEEQYRSLVASIPDAVWKVDREGSLTFMSPQGENILGYSMAELYQQRASIWINSIHIDDRQRVKQALEALFDDGRPYDIEFRAQRKNGEWFWAHDRAVATHDKNGIRVATGLLSDITERKKAEEGLLRLASIVEFSEDAIIGKTTEGVITSWNRAAERMYGYTKTEVLGRNLSFLVIPERREEIRALIERVRAGHSVECFETQRFTKEGSVLDVSLSVSPIKDASGQVTGASAIARDLTPRKRDAEQLRLQAAALEVAANAIVITDYEGKIVWVNRAFTTMTGYNKEEVLGTDPRLLNSGEQSDSYYATLRSTISSGKVWKGELVNRRKDGTTYTEEMTITPIAQNVGQANWSHFIAIKQDITERKRAEEELYRAHQMLQTILNTIPQRVFWKDRNCTYVGCNRAFATDAGLNNPAEIVGKSDFELAWSGTADRYRADDKRVMEQGLTKLNFDETQSRTDGSLLWLRTSKLPLWDREGKVIGVIGTYEDITERKVAEDRVKFLAFYDALTELPNRALLQDRLSKALASARRRKDKVALLFLDLNRFKDINDSLGHLVGDLLLQEVAERLKKWAREQDTVARVGGDEFVIVLTAVKDGADAAVAAERLMHAMSAGFVVEGRSLSISCSLGISVFPEHGADSETLIKNADAAMYCAKENEGRNFRFFTDDMNAQAVERLTLENGLRLALDKKELFLVYQPQVDIVSGKIIGLEAPDVGPCAPR
jgi:diguanylate cyclase (GGDEF)-like protein/PAS domain S-box-containing protein